MKDHAFVGKVYTELEYGTDEEGQWVIIHSAGEPVVAQVKGAKKGSLAQVCDVCGETAAENGQTLDHE